MFKFFESDRYIMWVCVVAIFLSGSAFSLVFLGTDLLAVLGALANVATIFGTLFAVTAFLRWKRDRHANEMHDQLMELAKAVSDSNGVLYLIPISLNQKNRERFSGAARQILDTYYQLSSFERSLFIYTTKRELTFSSLGCPYTAKTLDHFSNLIGLISMREQREIGEQADYVVEWYDAVLSTDKDKQLIDQHIKALTNQLPHLHTVAHELKSIDVSKIAL
ncbi:hypothetical protein [Vibrio vulnificus]|uniref:hypothetical protein n=1 Tax=Vibrio vulnificus TaxID=672 RepID=UPI00030AAB1D|nr:hypothetical protein [Vibrio vulnificus]MDF4415102.1 hypothetical protein [Vibrio parahaemolyticus]EGR0040850.1 hypothetical protein [Vibrio vulnificus]EGR0093372.1 hypothetical protein [Vibrio vulnificus]EHU9442482.1 hypothetical protein [Vibrio vulnificus]EID4338809.1 hypothetical protein [Vibrio vulnificus]